MARARNIKPGFFRNADLAELPVEARLLFIGLWTIADREGRLKDRPKQIKMEIFPADNYDCNDLIQQIADAGMLVRYEHGGARYLQITNFTKHQNPHKDEQASIIPAQGTHDATQVKEPAKTPISEPIDPVQQAKTEATPCIPDASTVHAPCTPDASTEVARLNPESLLLNPESLTLAAAIRPAGAACVSATPQNQTSEAIHPKPSMETAACVAMRAVGLAAVNPSNPKLHALVAAGASIDALADAAKIAAGRGKGFAYALSIVESQLAEAAGILSNAASKPAVNPAFAGGI
jgi:hypothetical protein